MATAEEVLQTMAEVPESAPVCVIDPETRTIIMPPEYQLFGVENDKRTERLYFQCPKIVGDNQDLSRDYQLFINYQNANGDPDAYHIKDMEVDGDNITFSWLLEENVTKYRGNIQFAFGAIIPGDETEDPDKNRWNTTINTDCTCLVGLKCTQQVAESNPDALVQIWAAIDELKAGGGGGTGGTTNYKNLSNKPQLNGVTLEGNKTLDQVGVLAKNQGASNSGKFLSVGSDGNVVPADAPSGGSVDPEQIKQAVNGYLEENPVSGMTAEQEQQLGQNTQDVADLKSTNDDFVVKIFNLASSVENVFKNVVFKSANTESFDYLSNLVQNLKPSEMVTIKYSLTNCTIDNNVTHAMKGSNFTATITPDSGTEFQSLKVTMGGADVTETVVTDKTINISNVTGDIIITAVSLNYVYSSGNGDAYIDTDWIMTDLGEKIVVGVQLSETNPTNNIAAFLGVNADSAFSSIYSAIEVSQQSYSAIAVGWGKYQPTSNAFVARHGEDFKNKIYYISLTNGDQRLWEDEDMYTQYSGTLAESDQAYSMEASKIPPFPLWLFRSNIQDVAYQSAAKKTYRSPGVKISCFKVYDADGILTVNMRAAKRSNDGVVGFYDTVRKRFFENACDTGDLIGG